MIFKYKHLVIIVFINLCIGNAFAEPQLSINNFIELNKWDEASKALFIEARVIKPKEYSIAIKQAQAGFVEDAIKTANDTWPTSKVSLLLEISKVKNGIAANRKKELIIDALTTARSMTNNNYIKSGLLTRISLYYLSAKKAKKSSLLFEEAIVAAKIGFDEKGNGGCRAVSKAIIDEGIINIPDYMLSSLSECNENYSELFNKALGFIELSKLYFRVGSKEEAMNALNKGFIAAKESKKSAPLDAVAKVALLNGEVAFAKQAVNLDRLLPERAINLASKGKYFEAEELISKMKDTLYVGYKNETLRKIIHETIKIKDQKGVNYFLPRVHNMPFSNKIRTLTEIAQFQLDVGNTEKAVKVFEYATNAALSEVPSGHSYQTRSFISLSDSLFKNGYRIEAKSILTHLITNISEVSRSKLDYQVLVQTEAALTLYMLKKPQEATSLLLDSYRLITNSNADNRKRISSKVRNLIQIAETLSKMKSWG